jgi:hypothetical protein
MRPAHSALLGGIVDDATEVVALKSAPQVTAGYIPWATSFVSTQALILPQ